MRFKSKKSLPVLRLYAKDQLLYDNFLKDVPLKESVILEKSILFFDDPEPCHIHRSAVRTRLTAEIQREFEANPTGAPGALLLSYVDFTDVDRCTLT